MGICRLLSVPAVWLGFRDQKAYVLDMLSWVKRSQKPKTGLARTSRTAYATISASTPTIRAPSAMPQMLWIMSENRRQRSRGSLHRVNGPEDEGEPSNGSKESLGLVVLASSGSTPVECKLVDDDKISNAGNGIPAPLLSVIVTEGGK